MLPVKLYLFVYHNFQYFRGNKILSDITLICEDKHFPAHKLILCTVSDYFLKIICDNTFGTLDVSKLTMINVTHTILKHYLDHIYGEYDLKFSDWRETMDFFDYMDYTQTHFDYENDLLHGLHSDTF